MKLAVLGSPIAHSKSPALHAAAYRVLGLDWSYEAVEVDGAGLAAFVESRGVEWRGLSLTMPLKRDILPLLHNADPLVGISGSANTVLLEKAGPRGFNTDIYGITRSFREHGIEHLADAVILGGGATAGNAIIAAAQLGAGHISVVVRDPARAQELDAIAERWAVTIDVDTFDRFRFTEAPEALINTLPNGVVIPLTIPRDVVDSSILFDVTYDPWPTPLASAWAEDRAINGLQMLLYQALVQVRIFVGGEPDKPLDREDEVLAAMRAAVTN